MKYEEGGSLKIYLHSSMPAGAPASNQLPVPKGKSFTVNMRRYVPKKDLLTGEY